jgi:tRNA(Ile)-lysidine synthase
LKKITKTDIAFLKKIKDTLRHYGMIKKGDRILVAVSGGADSVCLFKALLMLKSELGVELVVANMDHCLRGTESKSDSGFVRLLAKREGTDLFYKKVDVRSGGKKGISTEERAREKRYAFLKKAAAEKSCSVIATGHTMDDQAETVLMRVLKGSSLAGVAGIPPTREEGRFKVVRPLIRTERKEIESFLKRNGASFVSDSSNKEQKYLRNKVRLKILPYLEKENPRLKRTLTNLADSVREDLVLLNANKKTAKGTVILPAGAPRKIKTADIIMQPKSTRKDLFKGLFKNAGGNVKKLNYRHWMEMDQFLRTAQKKKSLDFPGDVRVTKTRDELVFAKRPKLKK